MKKASRDRRIENRRLSHITEDVSVLDDIIGTVHSTFVGKDENGYNEELDDIHFYDFGSEEHIKAERKIRYEKYV